MFFLFKKSLKSVILSAMTDRYAFRYVETTVQATWRNKGWAQGDSLADDVTARLTGAAWTAREAPGRTWGVLTPVCKEQPPFELIDSYGADAVRVTMLQPGGLSDAALTGAWRWMNALWLGLRDCAGQAPDWRDPALGSALQALQKDDLTALLVQLKSLFHAGPRPALAVLLYPFVPHLVTHLVPDVHERMPAYRAQWQTVLPPPVLFIEVNGKRVADFVPGSLDARQIEKEALSFPLVQRKIKGRAVRAVKIIPSKGVNFVV